MPNAPGPSHWSRFRQLHILLHAYYAWYIRIPRTETSILELYIETCSTRASLRMTYVIGSISIRTQICRVIRHFFACIQDNLIPPMVINSRSRTKLANIRFHTDSVVGFPTYNIPMICTPHLTRVPHSECAIESVYGHKIPLAHTSKLLHQELYNVSQCDYNEHESALPCSSYFLG